MSEYNQDISGSQLIGKERYGTALDETFFLIKDGLVSDPQLRSSYEGFRNAVIRISKLRPGEVGRVEVIALENMYTKMKIALRRSGYEFSNDQYIKDVVPMVSKLATVGASAIFILTSMLVYDLALNHPDTAEAQEGGTPDEMDLYETVIFPWVQLRQANCENWGENWVATGDLSSLDCPWAQQNGAVDNTLQWGGSQSALESYRIINYFRDPARFNDLLHIGLEMEVPESVDNHPTTVANVLWYIASQKVRADWTEGNDSDPDFQAKVMAEIDSWDNHFVRIGTQVPMFNEFFIGRGGFLNWAPSEYMEGFGLVFRFDKNNWKALDQMRMFATDNDLDQLANRAETDTDLQREIVIAYLDILLNKGGSFDFPEFAEMTDIEEILSSANTSGLFMKPDRVKDLLAQIQSNSPAFEIDVFSNEFTIEGGALADTPVNLADGVRAD